jgi:hypothetical protein
MITDPTDKSVKDRTKAVLSASGGGTVYLRMQGNAARQTARLGIDENTRMSMKLGHQKTGYFQFLVDSDTTPRLSLVSPGGKVIWNK